MMRQRECTVRGPVMLRSSSNAMPCAAANLPPAAPRTGSRARSQQQHCIRHAPCLQRRAEDLRERNQNSSDSEQTKAGVPGSSPGNSSSLCSRVCVNNKRLPFTEEQPHRATFTSTAPHPAPRQVNAGLLAEAPSPLDAMLEKMSLMRQQAQRRSTRFQ